MSRVRALKTGVPRLLVNDGGVFIEPLVPPNCGEIEFCGIANGEDLPTVAGEQAAQFNPASSISCEVELRCCKDSKNNSELV